MNSPNEQKEEKEQKETIESKEIKESNAPNDIMDWFKKHGLIGGYTSREKLFQHPEPLINNNQTSDKNIIMPKWLKTIYGP